VAFESFFCVVLDHGVRIKCGKRGLFSVFSKTEKAAKKIKNGYLRQKTGWSQAKKALPVVRF